LQQHPGIREEFSENPNAFMRQEQRFDRREDGRDRDGDTTHAQLARMDQFLDSHPEIAEQLRKDPGLMKSDEFTKSHPALQEFLQQHPGIRQEVSENPNAFMRQEQRFDRREDNRGMNSSGRDLQDFGQFLGGHSKIAQQLSQDPRLANDQQFIDSHPELQHYLNTHPGVKGQLTQNPRAVMTGLQPPATSNPNNNAGKPFNLDTKPTPMQSSNSTESRTKARTDLRTMGGHNGLPWCIGSCPRIFAVDVCETEALTWKITTLLVPALALFVLAMPPAAAAKDKKKHSREVCWRAWRRCHAAPSKEV